MAEKVLTEQNPEMRTGVADHNELPWALRLLERKNVFSTKAFRDGLFEVQDAASQLVVPMLEPIAAVLYDQAVAAQPFDIDHQ